METYIPINMISEIKLIFSVFISSDKILIVTSEGNYYTTKPFTIDVNSERIIGEFTKETQE